jgi:hypothetical protein
MTMYAPEGCGWEPLAVCPTCGSGPGEPCRDARERPPTRPLRERLYHVDRLVLTYRAPGR